MNAQRTLTRFIDHFISFAVISRGKVSMKEERKLWKSIKSNDVISFNYNVCFIRFSFRLFLFALKTLVFCIARFPLISLFKNWMLNNIVWLPIVLLENYKAVNAFNGTDEEFCESSEWNKCDGCRAKKKTIKCHWNERRKITVQYL